jgi:hypothetical protein
LVLSRAVVVAAALAFMPEACAKLLAKKAPATEPEPAPEPPPAPMTSATAPPIWAPPDNAAGTTPGASGPGVTAPPASPELVKARAAAGAKEWKKVRALLEKRVRAGKCAPEESQLVSRACAALKDKACVDAVKAKHPEDVAAE